MAACSFAESSIQHEGVITLAPARLHASNSRCIFEIISLIASTTSILSMMKENAHTKPYCDIPLLTQEPSQRYHCNMTALLTTLHFAFNSAIAMFDWQAKGKRLHLLSTGICVVWRNITTSATTDQSTERQAGAGIGKHRSASRCQICRKQTSKSKLAGLVTSHTRIGKYAPHYNA